MSGSAPIILGFDTSDAACEVALCRGDEVLASTTEAMARGQAERLMGLCHQVLRDTGVNPSDLDAIGVGIGPGNFTGIRISVAASRGLALGLGIPAVGISAFEALRLGTQGACACAISAKRDDVYLQTFDRHGIAADAFCAASSNLPAFEGSLIGHGGIQPLYPRAVAICHLTRARFRQPQPRPAPLYLRPADAAPAREQPPVILT